MLKSSSEVTFYPVDQILLTEIFETMELINVLKTTGGLLGIVPEAELAAAQNKPEAEQSAIKPEARILGFKIADRLANIANEYGKIFHEENALAEVALRLKLNGEVDTTKNFVIHSDVRQPIRERGQVTLEDGTVVDKTQEAYTDDEKALFSLAWYIIQHIDQVSGFVVEKLEK
jgi:hypothetical protein